MTRPYTGRFLKTAEVAQLFNVSPKTVTRWATERRLPFFYTLGGHRRFPEAAIRELAAGLVQPVTDPWQGGGGR